LIIINKLIILRDTKNINNTWSSEGTL